MATFNELLPRLISSYELPARDMTAQDMSALLKLADQANRLSPVFSELSENIRTALPVVDFSYAKSKTELAQQATKSTEVIHTRQADVKTFAESICFEVIELRVRGNQVPEARASALRSARRLLCEKVQECNRPLAPVLTADLISQPLDSIIPILNEWFRNSCHEIASRLFQTMHILVQQDVVGLVEWPEKDVCKLNFFQHVITQDQIRRRRSQSVQQDDFSEEGFRSVRLETWEHIEGRNRYSIERHEHHVMNTKLNSIGSTQFPIPEDKQAFLSRVPPWIKQHLKILEGDLILEKVDRRHVGDDHWKTTPQLRSSYEIEPAIVLGHYVITGWGQKEVEKEVFRQRRLAATGQPLNITDENSRNTRRESGETYSKLMPWVQASSVASIALMLFCWLQPSVMVPISLLLGIGAVVLGAKTATAYSIWKHSALDMLFVTSTATALAAAIFALLCGLYGILFASWSVLLIAIPLGFIAYFVKQISVSRME